MSSHNLPWTARAVPSFRCSCDSGGPKLLVKAMNSCCKKSLAKPQEVVALALQHLGFQFGAWAQARQTHVLHVLFADLVSNIFFRFATFD